MLKFDLNKNVLIAQLTEDNLVLSEVQDILDLQKFSTYDFKLAIIGDFSKHKSKSMQDFIRESNKGNRIYFVDDLASALKKLT